MVSLCICISKYCKNFCSILWFLEIFFFVILLFFFLILKFRCLLCILTYVRYINTYACKYIQKDFIVQVSCFCAIHVQTKSVVVVIYKKKFIVKRNLKNNIYTKILKKKNKNIHTHAKKPMRKSFQWNSGTNKIYGISNNIKHSFDTLQQSLKGLNSLNIFALDIFWLSFSFLLVSLNELF